jgi:hypothetical protein
MEMGKKHFEEIARQIALIANRECRLAAAAAVADAAKQFNTRFDRIKFFVACGVADPL